MLREAPASSQDVVSKRDALIDAAVEVFSSVGFERATTKEIAARASCSEGLIHRYFHGKNGLLGAVMAAALERDPAGLPAERSEVACALADNLEAFLRSRLTKFWDERAVMRIVVAEGATDAAVGGKLGELARRGGEDTLREILERGISTGQVDTTIDLDVVSECITRFAFALGVMGSVIFRHDRAHLFRLADTMSLVLARGLAASTAACQGG